MFDSEKSKFMKDQEASRLSGLLISLGIKTPLSKILLVGPLLKLFNKLMQGIK